MPLYEYQCEDCGEVFEVRATFQEKEAGLVLVCPKCGSHVARQKLTVPSMLHGGREFSPAVCGPNAGSRCCG